MSASKHAAFTGATMKPNIFEIATKELSQDGFFTWLLQWADPDNGKYNAELQHSAQDFVKVLLKDHVSPDYDIRKVEAGRQLYNIDIYAIVNDEWLIVIEDKTFTGEHSDQLRRYKETGKEWCTEHHGGEPVCIYLKTGSEAQSSLEKIKGEDGYRVVDREELLDFFQARPVENDIYRDFVERIDSIERAEKAFETKALGQWDGDAWSGFYHFLDSRLKIKGWGYVPNASGGFLGLWWHSLKWQDYAVYLQIEQGNLCFKIGEVYENHSEIRNEWFSILMAKAEAKGFAEITKPQRFGSGTYMTVAIVKRQDWLGADDGLLDKERVIKVLQKYEAFLDGC
jgi:hypothetical protein